MVDERTCEVGLTLTPRVYNDVGYGSFGGTRAMTLGRAALTSVENNSRPRLMSQRTACTFWKYWLWHSKSVYSRIITLQQEKRKYKIHFTRVPFSDYAYESQ
jgi:hypothetical protein